MSYNEFTSHNNKKFENQSLDIHTKKIGSIQPTIFQNKKIIDPDKILNSSKFDKKDEVENSNHILLKRRPKNKLTFDEFINKCKLSKINMVNKEEKLNKSENNNLKKNSAVF